MLTNIVWIVETLELINVIARVSSLLIRIDKKLDNYRNLYSYSQAQLSMTATL